MDKTLFKHVRIFGNFKNQTELSEALGVTQSTISKWENGHAPITEKTKQKVIKALASKGIDQDIIYLLSGLKSKQN